MWFEGLWTCPPSPCSLCLVDVGPVELPVVTAQLVTQYSGQCGVGIFPALVIY